MNEQSAIVFLSLGSNQGDKSKNIRYAIHALESIPGTSELCLSGIWRTAAWGKTDQDDFLNCAVSIRTLITPAVLMERIIEIEKNMGRIRAEHWGPRIIDIDILFYGNEIIRTESLVIPHPELQNRKFVLAPLLEIAPDFIHPVFKKSITQLLSDCTDQSMISEAYQIELK